jgi:hypothetical protein
LTIVETLLDVPSMNIPFAVNVAVPVSVPAVEPFARVSIVDGGETLSPVSPGMAGIVIIVDPPEPLEPPLPVVAFGLTPAHPNPADRVRPTARVSFGNRLEELEEIGKRIVLLRRWGPRLRAARYAPPRACRPTNILRRASGR